MKKLIAIAVALTLLLTIAISAPVAASNTWHVYDGDSIQDVIDDDASPGDTIIVHEGTYWESVVVNVDNLTISAEDGEDMPVVIGGPEPAFSIEADGVIIDGFRARSRSQ